MIDRTAWMMGTLLAAGTLLVGCGARVDDNSSLGNDSSAGGTVSSDTSGSEDPASTTSISGTSTSQQESGSESGFPACDGFGDAPGAPVSLGVRNATPDPIFLVPQGCDNPLQLTGPGAPRITFPDCDLPACALALQGSCEASCAGACREVVVRVDPGATYVREWDGGVWAEATLPTECLDAGCAPQCFQKVPAEPAEYGLQVRWAACPNDSAAACACPPGETTCTIETDNTTTEPTTHSTAFSYPMDRAPTIIIR